MNNVDGALFILLAVTCDELASSVTAALSFGLRTAYVLLSVCPSYTEIPADPE